jgi:hypothetical protein
MMTKQYSNPSTTLERLSHMSTNEALGVLRYYVITRDIDFNRRPLVQFLNECHVQQSLSEFYPDSIRLRCGRFPGDASISEEKKLQLLAAYVDLLQVTPYTESPTFTQFVAEVFGDKPQEPQELEECQEAVKEDGDCSHPALYALCPDAGRLSPWCCPDCGAVLESREPPDPEPEELPALSPCVTEADMESRYDELLAPLESSRSLPAVVVSGDSAHRLVKIPITREHLAACIEIMQTVDASELPPPGTTIARLEHDGVNEVVECFGFQAKLVSSENGPFIDVFMGDGDSDIYCEYKPIRDTKFLEGQQLICMAHAGCTYEFEIVPVD